MRFLESRGFKSCISMTVTLEPLADLRRTAWTEMANKGATVPELAASAGWSMDTAAKNMDTYVVTSRPLLMPVMDAGKRK